jgi:hypothetical protein
MNALGPHGIARRYPLGTLDKVESPLPAGGSRSSGGLNHKNWNDD